MLLHFVSTPYFTGGDREKEQGHHRRNHMGEDSPDSAVYYTCNIFTPIPVRTRCPINTAKSPQPTHKALTLPSTWPCAWMVSGPARSSASPGGSWEAEPPRCRRRTGGRPAHRTLRGNMEVALLVSSGQSSGGASVKPPCGSGCWPAACASCVAPDFIPALRPCQRNLTYDIDFSAGTGTIIIGGESQEPEQVLRD